MKKDIIKIKPISLLGTTLDSLIILNINSNLGKENTSTYVTFVICSSEDLKPNQQVNYLALNGYKANNLLLNKTANNYSDAQTILAEQLGITIV